MFVCVTAWVAGQCDGCDVWDVSSSWYPSDDIPHRKPLEPPLVAAANDCNAQVVALNGGWFKSVFPSAKDVMQSLSEPWRKSAPTTSSSTP